ncbi:MAG: hypothetical protein AAFR61_22140 [Bacteroidota bacterium]
MIALVAAACSYGGGVVTGWKPVLRVDRVGPIPAGSQCYGWIGWDPYRLEASVTGGLADFGDFW